jgi:hypothetical protein
LSIHPFTFSRSPTFAKAKAEIADANSIVAADGPSAKENIQPCIFERGQSFFFHSSDPQSSL